MTVLGIDTATPVASAALVDNGVLVLEKCSPDFGQDSTPGLVSRASHIETLFPLVEGVFREAGLTWSRISAIAVAIGPGSFTGLRIGLSAAKGFAYGSNIPIVGVSTLLAVAYNVEKENGWLCPLLDAKRKEVYGALFRREAGITSRAISDMVASPQKVLQKVMSVTQSDPCLFIGIGSTLYEGTIRYILGSRAHMGLNHASPSIAFAVARIGEEKICKGEVVDLPELLVPRYLRPSDAGLSRNAAGEDEPAIEGYLPIDKDEPLG